MWYCMIPEASSGLRLAAASRVQSSRHLLLCPGSFWSFVFLGISGVEQPGTATNKSIHSVSFSSAKYCWGIWCWYTDTATLNNQLGQKIKMIRTACSCAFFTNMPCSCWPSWVMPWNIDRPWQVYCVHMYSSYLHVPKFRTFNHRGAG